MAYQSWRYASRELLRDFTARQFRENARNQRLARNTSSWLVDDQEDNALANARRRDNEFNEPVFETARPRDGGGGGGFWGKVKGVGGDVLSTAGEVLDAPRKYVGAPAFAIASGQLEAERKPILDAQGRPTGQYYREKPGFGDVWESLTTAFTQDPRDTYGEAREASEERFRNPDLSAFERTLMDLGQDPLMLVPAGAVGAAARKLPEGSRVARGVKTALTARRSPIGALAEGPARAAYPGVVLGSAAGAQLAESTDIPGVPEGVERFGERALGAAVGGVASYRALRRAGGGAGAPRPSVIESEDADVLQQYIEVLTKNGVDPAFDEEGRLLADVQELSIAIARSNDAADKQLMEEVLLSENIDPAVRGAPWPEKTKFEPLLTDADRAALERRLQTTDDYRKVISEQRMLGRDDAHRFIIENRGATPRDLHRAIGEEIQREMDDLQRGYTVPAGKGDSKSVYVEGGGRRFERQSAAESAARSGLKKKGYAAAQSTIDRNRMARGTAYIEELSMVGNNVDRVAEVGLEPLNKQHRTKLKQALKAVEEEAAAKAAAAPKVAAEGTVKRAEMFGNLLDPDKLSLQMKGKPYHELSSADAGEVMREWDRLVAEGDPRVTGRQGVEETFQTEGELAGLRQQQVGMDLEGQRAAFEGPQRGEMEPTPVAPEFQTREGEVFLRGDRAKWTGRQDFQTADGKPLYEVEMLEGHEKGQLRWTRTKPAGADTASGARVSAAQGPPAGEVSAAPPARPKRALTHQDVEKLPVNLAGAKPNYSFGSKRFNLTFESDVDKALFIVAQATPSKRDAEYMAYLEDIFNDLDADQIRARGRAVRERIKGLAKDAPEGNLRVSAGALEEGVGEGLSTGPLERPRQVLTPRGVTDVRTPEGAPPPIRRAYEEPLESPPAPGGPERIGAAPRTAPIGSVEGPRAEGSDVPFGAARTGGPETPPSLPEAPPPREPGAPQFGGKGGTRGFGETSYDILHGAELITRSQKRRASALGRLSEKMKTTIGRMDPTGGKVDDPIDAFKRMAHRIDAYTASRIQLERARMHEAGMDIVAVDGENRLLVDGADVGLAEDIIEGTSDAGRAVREQLTPEQADVLAYIDETNRQINSTMQFNGAEVALDEDVLGTYFGRRVLSRTIDTEGGLKTIENAQGPHQARRVGTKRQKSRVFESVEQAREAGFNLDDPWVARAFRLRGKLQMAQDSFVEGKLRPLAQQTGGGRPLGLEGVNQPGLAGQWFTPPVARRIEKGLARAEKGLLENFAKINQVLTPLRASFDLSATLQQGTRMWLTNPKAAADYWWQVVRSLGDDTVYEGMLLSFDAKMRALGGSLSELAETGLRITDESSSGEFFFPQKVLRAVEKVPGGRALETAGVAANKHFGRLLNSYRMHFAINQYGRFKAAGLEGDELVAAMMDANAGINRMFGWTETEPFTWEKAAVFAPRYLRASLETAVKAIEGLNPNASIDAKMARDHMGLLLAEGAAAVWLINTARGYETEFDPTDSNFLRIRNAGGLDISPFGTYNTLFRGIAGLAIGDQSAFADPNVFKQRAEILERVAWGKLSPALKGIYEPFVKRETFLGEPVDILGDPAGFLLETAKSSLPFSFQNLMEGGSPQERGIGAAIGGLGVSSTPVTPGERRNFARDRVAQEMFGAKYDDLSGRDKSRVNESEDVTRWQQEVDRRSSGRADESGELARIRQETSAFMAANAQYLANGRDDAGNLFTGNDYRQAYQDMQRYFAGRRDALGLTGGDSTLNGWYDLYDQAQMANGQIDYEQLERLQSEYRAAHPDVDAKVDEFTGTRDDATLREYRQAQALARDYYQLPAYRGMSLEDAEKASQYMAIASAMVSQGIARDRDRALRMLDEQLDPDARRLVREATRRGSNPDRARFRRENPLFGKFYSELLANVA